ncbi:hypothetical protein JOB18_011805, partial [Solea senegalensis]
MLRCYVIPPYNLQQPQVRGQIHHACSKSILSLGCYDATSSLLTTFNNHRSEVRSTMPAPKVFSVLDATMLVIPPYNLQQPQ